MKILLPIVNTDKLNFDSDKKWTDEEFINEETNYIHAHNRSMNQFVYNFENGILNSKYDKYAAMRYNHAKADIVFEFRESVADFEDYDNFEVTEDELLHFYDLGKMFLLNLNIHPDTIGPDAESELRFWLEDSRLVEEDDELDDKTRLLALPKRDLKVIIKENEYTMKGCKVLQNNSTKKRPFDFTIIVEKLEK